MRREPHVRFCEGGGVRFPSATRLVVGFQYRRDAERFLEAVKERFGNFELEMHPEKTRLIEFGRYAIERRRRTGQSKPETFDFLGFTHCCAKTRNGRFRLGRNPVARRMTRTLKRVKEALRRRMHHDVEDVAQWLGKVVNGWLNYFAVPNSSRYLRRFVLRLKRIWHHILCRRSQKDRFSWVRLSQLTEKYWPKLEIRHPWPGQRIAVNSTQGRSLVP